MCGGMDGWDGGVVLYHAHTYSRILYVSHHITTVTMMYPQLCVESSAEFLQKPLTELRDTTAQPSAEVQKCGNAHSEFRETLMEVR